VGASFDSAGAAADGGRSRVVADRIVPCPDGESALARPEVPADKLIVEITETAAIESCGAAQDFIRQIRPYGCRFALDDFSSGYTSYARTVAEYVETPLILAKLREIGIDYAQGYAIHKPRPIGEMTDQGVRM